MLAVSVRAYHAALILLDTIQRVGKDAKDTSAMILPADASPDLSPLFVTCCNDTCSFTWTGAEHINQVMKKECSVRRKALGAPRFHEIIRISRTFLNAEPAV